MTTEDRAALKRCAVARSVFEKLKLVGPMVDSKAVMTQLHEDGWRITQSGSYSDRKMFPKVDPTRFLYYAEREMDTAENSRLVAEVERLRKVADSVKLCDQCGGSYYDDAMINLTCPCEVRRALRELASSGLKNIGQMRSLAARMASRSKKPQPALPMSDRPYR